jgi:hypothetical protein
MAYYRLEMSSGDFVMSLVPQKEKKFKMNISNWAWKKWDFPLY